MTIQVYFVFLFQRLPMLSNFYIGLTIDIQKWSLLGAEKKHRAQQQAILFGD